MADDCTSHTLYLHAVSVHSQSFSVFRHSDAPIMHVVHIRSARMQVHEDAAESDP